MLNPSGLHHCRNWLSNHFGNVLLWPELLSVKTEKVAHIRPAAYPLWCQLHVAQQAVTLQVESSSPKADPVNDPEHRDQRNLSPLAPQAAEKFAEAELRMKVRRDARRVAEQAKADKVKVGTFTSLSSLTQDVQPSPSHCAAAVRPEQEVKHPSMQACSPHPPACALILAPFYSSKRMPTSLLGFSPLKGRMFRSYQPLRGRLYNCLTAIVS